MVSGWLHRRNGYDGESHRPRARRDLRPNPEGARARYRAGDSRGKEDSARRGRQAEQALRPVSSTLPTRPRSRTERSEAPAPDPPPATPDPPPPSHSTKPQPPSGTTADTTPIPHSSPKAPQGLKDPRVRNERTAPPESVEPASTSSPPPAATSKQRLRRVVVPERPRKPVGKAPSGPVDEWVEEKARKKGHRLTPFKEQRIPLASEHDRRYVAECRDCKRKAYAIKAADPGWTTANTPWETQGPAFEDRCPGNLGR